MIRTRNATLAAFLLTLLALNTSCSRYADVATKVLEVTGPATLRAAAAGAAIHEKALNDLADEIERALKVGGCDTGETKPAVCAEVIADGRTRRRKLEERYAAFEKGILTADAVQAEVAYSISLYLVNKDKVSLMNSLSKLIGAWKVLAETLTSWGLDVPSIGG